MLAAEFRLWKFGPIVIWSRCHTKLSLHCDVGTSDDSPRSLDHSTNYTPTTPGSLQFERQMSLKGEFFILIVRDPIFMPPQHGCTKAEGFFQPELLTSSGWKDALGSPAPFAGLGVPPFAPGVNVNRADDTIDRAGGSVSHL